MADPQTADEWQVAVDLADRPFYREIIRHPNLDDFWLSYSLKGRYSAVETPALFVTGWYDNVMNVTYSKDLSIQ